MSKVTLNTITNLQDTTAIGQINGNNSITQTAFDNTLSRDGTTPNQMVSNLDMNNNNILNLPDATQSQEPVTLNQFNNSLQGIASGVVVNGPYILASHNSSFTSDRTLAAGSGVTIVDGGAKGSVTISAPQSPPAGGTNGQLLVAQTGSNPTWNTATGDVTVNSTGVVTIPNSTVTNAKLANSAAWTLKCNNSSSSAAPTDVTIDGLTVKGSPTNSDEVPIWDAATSQMKKATLGSLPSGTATVTSFNTLTGAVTTNVTKQVFTSSGTYTPTSGMLHCIIECIGGGGGGAGTSSVPGSAGAGGGGGSGGYSRSYKTAAQIGASQTVTIGTGGTGGAAGDNNGISGGGRRSWNPLLG